MVSKKQEQHGGSTDDLRYKHETKQLTHPVLDKLREERTSTNRPRAPRTHGEYALAAAAVIAFNSQPAFQCKKCGWPYLNGMVCSYCDDPEPYDSTVQPESSLAVQIGPRDVEPLDAEGE